MAAAISKAELFVRLAAGHAAGVTVVTPDVGLSRALSREFDQAQIGKGLAGWEAADVLPLSRFVERLYEDARYSNIAADLPPLFSPAQEQALWEEVLAGADLLVVSQAAAQVRKAWGLAHEWRIAGALGSFPGNEDARAFAAWTRRYREKTSSDTDAARLPDIVAPLLKEAALRRPKLLVAYAFDVVKPQEQDFLDACARQGIEVLACSPGGREGSAGRMPFPSAREELEAAATWARARLEAGEKRIGVVVPDLGKRRKEVARVFARVMRPAFNLPGARPEALPFNISYHVPLAEYPLAHAALSILELCSGEVPFEQASRLIRSPFLAGADAECSKRALLDAALRETAPARITLGKLVALVEGAGLLRQALEALFALARAHPGGERSLHDWARHFSALLEAAGFPGERGLDSSEFQTQASFHQALAEFARLDRVAPKMSFTRALARLRRLCADVPFLPETPDAPIQVLGALESAGLEFDALWVSGLTDEAWPLAAAPNPFIAPALQRKAGIPEASAEASLARGKRITGGWLAAAPEVVFSWPAMEEDRALVASSLISGFPEEKPKGRTYERYRDVIFAARRLEAIPDGQAPALATKTPRGGTRILADQAACPFRAFARHRLAAEALEEPVAGPDALVRGQMLHTLMKEIWHELKDSSALQKEFSSCVERAAAVAVKEAALEEPFAGMERKRLARRAREWLEVERSRSSFRIFAVEHDIQLHVAGLQLKGRIDRMDELACGGHAVIDYKAGRPTPNDWMGARPEEPQLPLYALSAKVEVSAVAFAKLKTGEMKYMGFSRDKNALPGVKQSENWETLTAGWKRETDALGAGFAAGEARVDPKDGLATCRYCDLHTMCRVFEKLNPLVETEKSG